MTGPESLARAEGLYSRRQFADVEAICRQILKSQPECAGAWRLLGLMAHEAGESHAALAALQRAVGYEPSATHYQELGLVQATCGDEVAAAESLSRAQDLAPPLPGIHNNLGASWNALQHPAIALQCFREALRHGPEFAVARINLARTLLQMGDINAAVNECRQGLAYEPTNAELHYELSRAHAALGTRTDEFLELEQAVRLRPIYPEAHNDLGVAFARQGRWEEALASFQQSLQQRPGNAAAYNNLGLLYRRLGRLPEAKLAFLFALRGDPRDADIHFGLGQVLEQQGDWGEALISFETATKLNPNRAELQRARGRVLALMGRTREALGVLKVALNLPPFDPSAAVEYGNLCQEVEDWNEAERAYRLALQAQPQAATCGNLAYLLADQGRMDDAHAWYERGRQLQPAPNLQVAARVMLPPVYGSLDEMQAVRQRLAANLDELAASDVRVDPTAETMPTLFYLAYQGQNDRDLQVALARLGQGPRSAEIRIAPRARLSRLHVGVLSRNFKNHTIGGLNLGLVERLDRRKFMVTVLSIGDHRDTMGLRFRQSADRYVTVSSKLPQALEQIAAQGLDIVYFADVGMDPFTYTLAYTRLAPVQCMTWGHPVTSGLPDMDYFISSVDLDTEQAGAHYTERLVRLGSPSVCYHRPDPPAVPSPRGQWGLTDQQHVYLCPQTLFKFHPEFDGYLAEILRRDPLGVIVLIEGRFPSWRTVLWERFGRGLPDVRDRIHFVPRQPRAGFLDLVSTADVLLDPIHFGGGNTSYEGLSLGVPIVTLPSELLRGRITYALYRKMGVTRGVVSSRAEYVARALQWGTDRAERDAARREILASNSALFEDETGLRELEQFFESVAP